MKRAQLILTFLLLLGVTAPVAPVIAQRTPGSQTEIDLTFAPLVKKAAPAVVNIFASKKVQTQLSPFMDDPLFRRFFGDAFGGIPRERMERSLGSGVIVRPNGTVVTNAHVIKDADQVRVVLADRREFEAEIALVDERTDLAVLTIDAGSERLAHLELADKDEEVEVGDLVLAIGNPFGVGQTVTQGIVSAQARTRIGVSDYNFFIQTDAAINPGNSGGALIDVRGNLIGVNTAIFSRSGGSLGIGFAVPVEMVRVILDGLDMGGRIARPWLGATGQAVDREMAETLDLDRPAGMLINSVYPDGPADKAGLKRGDVIVRVNDKPVNDPEAVRFRIATLEPNKYAEIKAIRSGSERTFRLRAAVPPEDTPRNETRLEGANPLAGATVANLSPALAAELGLQGRYEGVIVSEVSGGRVPANRLGVKPGDIVREVNGTTVSSVRQLKRLVDRRRSSWQLVLERDGRLFTLRVRN